MRALPLLDLRIRHAFYTDGRCPDFALEPDAGTAALLRKHRARLKIHGDGLSIACVVDGDDKPFVPFAEDAVFGFRLRLRNAAFPLFTDLSDVQSQTAPLYSNDGLGRGDGPALRLSSRRAWTSERLMVSLPGPKEPVRLGGKPLPGLRAEDFVLAEPAAIRGIASYDEAAGSLALDSRGSSVGTAVPISYPSRPALAAGVFADVEIRTNDSLPELRQLGERPAAFEIGFAPKRARWSYYCVTDLKNGSEDFAIEDGSAAGTPDVVFSAKNRTDLDKEPDPADRIAADLSARYPGLRKYRFVSDRAVPCRQAARGNLEFRLNGDPLVRSLPNPSLRNFSTTRVLVDGTPQQQDSLFQIIKFLTNANP